MRDFVIVFLFLLFAFTFYAIGYSQGAIEIATDIEDYLLTIPDQ